MHGRKTRLSEHYTNTHTHDDDHAHGILYTQRHKEGGPFLNGWMVPYKEY